VEHGPPGDHNSTPSAAGRHHCGRCRRDCCSRRRRHPTRRGSWRSRRRRRRSSRWGRCLARMRITVPARAGSARLGPARSGSARSGPGRLGPARAGSARLGPARPGSVRLGPARLGPARSGSARSGSVRLGSVRLGPARLGSVRLGPARLRRLGPAGLTRGRSGAAAMMCWPPAWFAWVCGAWWVAAKAAVRLASWPWCDGARLGAAVGGAWRRRLADRRPASRGSAARGECRAAKTAIRARSSQCSPGASTSVRRGCSAELDEPDF